MMKILQKNRFVHPHPHVPTYHLICSPLITRSDVIQLIIDVFEDPIYP
jgi:hypothetical protein